MFWSSSRAAVGAPLQALTKASAITSAATVLALGLLSSASAQNLPPAVAASPASGPAVVGVAAGAGAQSQANAALLAQFLAEGGQANASSIPPTQAASPVPVAGTTSGSRAPKEDASDPVSRFLADKGLLGTVAQQVRDKAADLASDLVISAMDFLGVRYKMGGQSRDSGFDCSGFTRHVFERSIGMVLPRRASEQANMPGLLQVSANELKPGDLVFFNTLRHTFSHVGIYVGDNKFIHSPRAGGEVRIEDMGLSYWRQRFDGARRVPRLVKANTSTASVQPPAPRTALSAAADIAP